MGIYVTAPNVDLDKSKGLLSAAEETLTMRTRPKAEKFKPYTKHSDTATVLYPFRNIDLPAFGRHVKR